MTAQTVANTIFASTAFKTTWTRTITKMLIKTLIVKVKTIKVHVQMKKPKLRISQSKKMEPKFSAFIAGAKRH
jgi:predicted secreted Zn-dependent protease